MAHKWACGVSWRNEGFLARGGVRKTRSRALRVACGVRGIGRCCVLVRKRETLGVGGGRFASTLLDLHRTKLLGLVWSNACFGRKVGDGVKGGGRYYA